MSPLYVYLVKREVSHYRKDEVQGESKPTSCSQAHEALIFKPLIPNRKKCFWNPSCETHLLDERIIATMILLGLIFRHLKTWK
jgi:hypothetical protein